MKKILCYLFVVLFSFERSAAYGVITSPDLATVLINDETQLDQDIQGWTIINKEGKWGKEKVELYAYNAWIIFKPAESRYEPGYAFKYVFVNHDQTKKIVFGKKLGDSDDPLNYKFRGPSYIEEKSDMLGCRPWKNGKKIPNKFPEDCDILEK
jgi:hypothetical protein